MKLNELSGVAGATKKRTRKGRGIGSGIGKTAGRGHKGQKSRSGVAINGFEGGQMPLYIRLPKSGFVNKFPNKVRSFTLSRLAQAIESGKIDAKKLINEVVLVTAGVIRKGNGKIKVIGNLVPNSALKLEIDLASAGAKKALDKSELILREQK